MRTQYLGGIEISNFFTKSFLNKIQSKFHYLYEDENIAGKRIFFDNGAGALRLKKSLEAFQQFDAFPDDPQKEFLEEVYEKGLKDVRTIFNAQAGSILAELSASQVMFKMTEAVIQNVPGKNVVITEGDHPSSYDAATTYSEKYNKDLRIAKTNPETGGTDVEEIVKLVDEETCLLSIIYASNISGAVLNVKEIVKEARKINPELYVIVDGVQYIPHAPVDVEELQVDGINFAPYKFFSPRGIGFGYASDRLAKLPHDRLIGVDEKAWIVGSPAVGAVAAVSEVVNYVCWIGSQFSSNLDRRELFVEGMNKINEHEKALMSRMLEGTKEIKGLRDIPGVTVYFDTPDLTKREFLIAMKFNDVPLSKSEKLLEERGIIVAERAAESIWAARQIKSFGIEGFLRVTPMHFNSKEDIDTFLNAVEEIAVGS